MASQTPGAVRGEAHGSYMTHQMAAGDAQLTPPRFDAHHQRDVQQHHTASIGGLSTHDIPPPQSSDYTQGTQNQSQYRSPMVSTVGPSTLPPFVSQKTTIEPSYSLQYPNEQPNTNPVSQARQNYIVEPASAPIDPQHRRPASSGSSADSSHRETAWPAMYTMHPGDQPQQQQQRPSTHQTQQQHLRSQQQHMPISAYSNFGHDVRNTSLFHVAATM